MKIKVLPILLLALGFSQLGAFKLGSGPKKGDDPKVMVRVLNKSGYDLKSVKLKPTRTIKFGVKKVASINIEGTDVPVVLPVVGKPHGVSFSDIKKEKSKSKNVKMRRFDVSKFVVTFKGRGTGRINKNVTKNIRIGRLKLDCIYWGKGGKLGVKRSYAFKDIKEILITVRENDVEVAVKAGF